MAKESEKKSGEKNKFFFVKGSQFIGFEIKSNSKSKSNKKKF